jgi:LacI family transcriptional regulator, gluconate utilization system Gnt-I transcriptional repressor
VVGSHATPDTRAAARTAGFLRQAGMRGLPRPAKLAVARPADIGVGPQLLQDILAIEPPIEAVFCVGTQISVGLMLACPRAGVNVPKRLAVAGFSDGELAAMLTPSLTTIRVPTAEMGRQAGRMLLARLAGTAVDAPTIDVGFELAVGAST